MGKGLAELFVVVVTIAGLLAFSLDGFKKYVKGTEAIGIGHELHQCAKIFTAENAIGSKKEITCGVSASDDKCTLVYDEKTGSISIKGNFCFFRTKKNSLV
ncbi:MAG: hypothetical protein D6831_00075, partial [Aquificota bacterium]